MSGSRVPGTTGSHPPRGMTALGAESFDAMAALGGWRGVAESVVPTLVFVLVLAARPTALVTALLASLALSAVALVARLAQREGLTQVLGGAVLAAVSAAWAWRSGSATNFYATGLLINAAWLVGCLASLALRWPLVGLVLNGFQALASPSQDTDGPSRDPDAQEDQEDAQAPEAPGWAAWRTDPALSGLNRRYRLGTWLLAAMFATRLAVEVPLYLARAAGPLGVARLVLGVPFFALTLWLVWLLVSPARRPAQD